VSFFRLTSVWCKSIVI